MSVSYFKEGVDEVGVDEMGRALHNCTPTSSLVPRPRGRRESMRPGNEANPQAANLGPLRAIMAANIIFTLAGPALWAGSGLYRNGNVNDMVNKI